MTAWDCLRTDWGHLLKAIDGDKRGRVEVHTEEGGSITVTWLNDMQKLAGTLRELTGAHPDPLEVVIRAEHNARLYLRSRHRRDGGHVVEQTQTETQTETQTKTQAAFGEAQSRLL